MTLVALVVEQQFSDYQLLLTAEKKNVSNPNCMCELAGYCERHKIRKHTRQFHLCKGVAGTPDCGFKYWRAWELGGMGATAVEDPVLVKNWACDEHETVTYPVSVTQPTPGLGDRVSAALALVGITEERVTKWIGRKCGCGERRRKLNQLGEWASKILSGDRTAVEEIFK